MEQINNEYSQQRKAKAFLSKSYRIDCRINSKIEQVASLRELATKATTTITDMPKSPSPSTSRMEDVIVKIVSLEQEINDDIDELIDLKKQIRTVIDSVEETELRLLLEERYINWKSWEEIAASLKYNLRYIHKLHNRALKVCKIPGDL